MAIDWKKFDTVFRLLAAVHAALGEDAFKGRFGHIAELYGPEASYDAIKAEWKKVARLGDELWRRRYGQAPGARAAQSTAPRRRQRRPRESIRLETPEVIVIDGSDEPSRAAGEASHVPASSRAPRKHNLETDHPPAAPEVNSRGLNKRARLNPATKPDIDRNVTNEPPTEVNYQALPRYSDDLFDQIRRVVSATPVDKSNTNPHAVTSSSNVDVVTSTVQPTATLQAAQSALDQTGSFELNELSQCQVSTNEHGRCEWDAMQQPLPPVAGMGRIQAHRLTPESGPSGVRPHQFFEIYQDENRAPYETSACGLDENGGAGGDPSGDPGGETQVGVSTMPDKGKARMVTPPMLPIVSYLDTERGLCHLCKARFGTVGELRVHERGQFHSGMLGDYVSVEKAQARIEKYGIFQQFCSESEMRFIEDTRHHTRTIIRGPDRAVDVDEDEDEVEPSSLQDVAEVRKTNPSARRTSGKNSGKPRIKKPLPATNVKNSKGPDLIRDSDQMARILQVNKFSRTGTIHHILTILERVLLSTTHKTAPKCFDQFSSQPPTPPHPASADAGTRYPKTGRQAKIWIIDAEFASLKGKGNRYDLSVNITNLISGETIVNHRLKLPLTVDELDEKIPSSHWQARRQFTIHYHQPCSMPIITPRELARMLKQGGFGPRDFVFVWHPGYTDYLVVKDFLAREELQHGLMPPEENVVRVLYAWKELLPPQVPCRLDRLFSLVFPKSPLRHVHHVADVDTKKLGQMTWKLRDLKYSTNGQPTELNLCT